MALWVLDRREQKFSLSVMENYLDFIWDSRIAKSYSPKVFLSLFVLFSMSPESSASNNPRLSGYFVQYGRECESPNSRILDMLMRILHIGRISGEDAHTECLLWAWEIVQHLGALTNIGVCMFCSPNHMLMYTIHRLLNDFWQD